MLTSALTMEHLNDLAEMAAVELLTIDTGTTVAQLRKEIRWNQAYYRLARGF